MIVQKLLIEDNNTKFIDDRLTFFLVCAMRNLCFLRCLSIKAEHKVLFLFFVIVPPAFPKPKQQNGSQFSLTPLKNTKYGERFFGAFLKFLCFRVYCSSKVNNQPILSVAFYRKIAKLLAHFSYHQKFHRRKKSEKSCIINNITPSDFKIYVKRVEVDALDKVGMIVNCENSDTSFKSQQIGTKMKRSEFLTLNLHHFIANASTITCHFSC